MRKIPLAPLKRISQPTGPHPITRLRPHCVAALYHVPRSLFAVLPIRQPPKKRYPPESISVAPTPSILSLELRAWRTPVHVISPEDETQSAVDVESYDTIDEDVIMQTEDIAVDEITTGIANIALDEVDQLNEQLISLKLEDEWNGEPMDIDPLPSVEPVWTPPATLVPPTTTFDLQFLSIVVQDEDIDMLDACDEMDSDANNDDTELPSNMMDLDEWTSSNGLDADFAMDVDEQSLAPTIQDSSDTMDYPMLMEGTARIALDPESVPAPIPIQKVDSLDLPDYEVDEYEISADEPPLIEGATQWSYEAVEELLLEADLLITDVKLEMEFNGDLDDDDELVFETDDEYDDDDADLLSQEADARTELLFGPPLRP